MEKTIAAADWMNRLHDSGVQYWKDIYGPNWKYHYDYPLSQNPIK